MDEDVVGWSLLLIVDEDGSGDQHEDEWAPDLAVIALRSRIFWQ